MLVIGLMSGTSLDGIDAALVEIHGGGVGMKVRCLAARTSPFPPGLREAVGEAVAGTPLSAEAFGRLGVWLGEAFGDAAVAVAEAAGVSLRDVDLVGSHGQTIWHAPGGPHPCSLQLGESAVIAERTGLTVVSDFRTADVAAGGEGAPLVPHVDFLLHGACGFPLVLQNVGGIANLTWLPGDGDPAGLVAFDTGPGNMVIDRLAERVSGLSCDRDGALALAGRVHEPLLERLMADAYFERRPPKSTGRERYGRAFADRLHEEAGEAGISNPDLLATATAWTAAAVADQYRRFLPASAWPREVWISGGGARNPALMAELGARLAPAAVRIHPDADAREAIAFAVLAHEALAGRPGSASVTGAPPRVLGKITPGRNFDLGLLAGSHRGSGPPVEGGLPATPEASTGGSPAAPGPSAGGSAAAPGGRLTDTPLPGEIWGLATEQGDPASADLDAMAAGAAVAAMLEGDHRAVQAARGASGAIAAVAEAVAGAFASGGRLIYVGAGTSGRLAVLDAAECPPTFSSPPGWVLALIAGGEPALTRAVEGAEDDPEAGAAALQGCAPTPRDVVVGVAASGRTPYVRGALREAARAGAVTALVSCAPPPAAFVEAVGRLDHRILLATGPEFLAGSTRLRAGTATKLALNAVTTIAMARSGKVHGHHMVDLAATNGKLRVRALGLLDRLAGVRGEQAAALLEAAGGSVKRAILMRRGGLSPAEATARLEAVGGSLRAALQQ